MRDGTRILPSCLSSETWSTTRTWCSMLRVDSQGETGVAERMSHARPSRGPASSGGTMILKGLRVAIALAALPVWAVAAHADVKPGDKINAANVSEIKDL